tara:strand:+ start:10919 stop:12331 length:1413 start_codon:yes stop_codon:yes gene_type:complete
MRKIFLLILLSFALFANSNQKVIAQVGNQFITVEDFIKRSEYTPRPLFCNGNSNLEKRIILNNLIGEKLFSMEYNQTIPQNIQNYLDGRKNQKMREILFDEITRYEIDEKNKYSHWNNLASIEYDISYITISDLNVVDNINRKVLDGLSLEDIYIGSTNTGDIPTKNNLNLFTVDNRALRENLFSSEWDSGDILGPIDTDDNMFMFLQINKKRKKINLNPNSKVQLQEEVASLINTHIKEKKYTNFVKDIMDGMEFELNGDVYIEFSNIVKTWYASMQSIDDINYINNDMRFEIKNKDRILLSLNRDEVSIDEVLKWINLHPLVFRDGHYKELDFIHQLKFALADLIRDHFLNVKSRELNLDSHIEVLSEYNTWYDNYCAISHRTNMFDENLINSREVSDELNEYFNNLTQKYSDNIKIDFDVLNNLKLSSIDMISYNKVGPYKLTVPLFPIITDSYKFNYGESITMRNK